MFWFRVPWLVYWSVLLSSTALSCVWSACAAAVAYWVSTESSTTPCRSGWQTSEALSCPGYWVEWGQCTRFVSYSRVWLIWCGCLLISTAGMGVSWGACKGVPTRLPPPLLWLSLNSPTELCRWYRWVRQSSSENRDLTKPRRRQQRERHWTKYLISSCVMHFSTLHFFAVLCKITAWNGHMWTGRMAIFFSVWT